MTRTVLLTLLLFAFVSCAAPRPSVRNESLTFAFSPPDSSDAVEANVVSVIDGVTIEVSVDGQIHTVKYLGVELPDAMQMDEMSDIFQQALEFNRFMVEGRTVQLHIGPVDTDAQGNLLRYVYVDGEMANETMITNGYATVADFPQRFEAQTQFLLLQDEARRNFRGIWESSEKDNQKPSFSTGEGSIPPRFGGTLPSLPSQSSGDQECEFSGTSIRTIKGVTLESGERVYYLPSNPQYSSILVNEARGDKLFCTEFDAIYTGWQEAD